MYPTTAVATSTWPWLVQGLQNITQGYNPPTEDGLDMALPVGTPITSLTTGKVRGTGYYAGGGVVSVSGLVNSQAVSVYYQHLDTIAPGIAPGAYVTAGQLLGTSGGELAGGQHPSTRQYSSGPHIEVGINAPYGGIWSPMGPNMDPTAWLYDVAAGRVTTIGSAAAQMAALFAWLHPLQANTPGFLPLLQDLHDAEQFPGFDGLNPVGSILNDFLAATIRGLFVVIGMILLLLVLWNVVKGPAQQALQVASQLPLEAML